ncbi:MAG TPA: efflux RND transporter periplasmic adaptor subunit [Planctomycetota bacterium]|nr:efflux RND transporter periplasmic adaptor subunit [Planctomycetota bacterium]
MDLEALKIDRSSGAGRSARRRSRGGLGWVGLALVVAVALWLFRAPLARKLDDLRLTHVRTLRVVATDPAAAAAVSGTAANGYVVARTRAALSADTPGRIVELNVSEGSVLKQGDVVARLYFDEVEAALRAAEADVTAQEASVTRAQAELGVARIDVERAQGDVAAAQAGRAEAEAGLRLATLDRQRAETLVAESVESQQRLDETRAAEDQARARLDASQARELAARAAADQSVGRLTAAEAAVDEARSRVVVLESRRDLAAATLEKTYVRAPFDGVVVLKDAEVGEVVSPNSQGGQSRGSVATMVDFDSLEVQVELPETSLSAVAVGAPASIFLDAWPGEAYAGRVQRIWPTANRQKASVEVRVGFERIDERLRPEMGARVVFTRGEAADQAAAGPTAGKLLVPSGTLVRVDGKRGVFVLERDTVRFRALTLGEERGGKVLVEAGLEDGELIVLAPPPSLADGERVVVDTD